MRERRIHSEGSEGGQGRSALGAVALAGGVLLFALSCGDASRAGEERAAPNILLLVADDLGWGDVSMHGSAIATPHIDRLAREGVELTSLYANPLCTPSRAALLTGRYPMRYGLQQRVIWASSRYGLPLGERTLAQELGERGYRTALCGKWHLGSFEPAYRPEQRGFDHAYGNLGAFVDYFEHTEGDEPDWWRNGEPVEEEGYATDLLAEEVVRWIAEGADSTEGGASPWFATVTFQAPHTPLQAPEAYLPPADAFEEGEHNSRLFAGMVAGLDAAVGKILAALDERGEVDDTLVVFVSDNGGGGRYGSSNDPFHGSKGEPSEGSVRVLGIARWPGVLPAGARYEGLAHLVDLYPTLANRAGTAPLPENLDGVDLWPAWTGAEPSPREEVLVVMGPTVEALRLGRWKLVCHYKTDDRLEPPFATSLFDVERDPGETMNLLDQQPVVARDMHARLKRYYTESVPPIFRWD